MYSHEPLNGGGGVHQLVAEEEVRDLRQEGNQCAIAGVKMEGSMNRNGGD